MRARDTISAAISAADLAGAAGAGRVPDGGISDAPANFRRDLAEVSASCDVVEIGVPFSDPMADGSTIQRASFAALAMA